MEISGNVLREVEFRDRLRGYDTDEVDEFLEKVAVAVDDLRGELAAAHSRAERAQREADSLPPADDDSLRRTLVLAQRTADLAISEAREEANQMLEQARSQAETMLADARQSAHSLRSDAERELETRVKHLGEEHDRLTRQVAMLSSLVEGERGRITDSLTSLLGYVRDSLNLTPEATAAAELPGVEQPSVPSYEQSGPDTLFDDSPRYEEREHFAPPVDHRRDEPVAPVDRDDPLDLGLPDIEAELGEDASFAFGSSARERGPEPTAAGELDPDEELWSRWANNTEPEEPEQGVERFRFGPRGEGEEHT